MFKVLSGYLVNGTPDQRDMARELLKMYSSAETSPHTSGAAVDILIKNGDPVPMHVDKLKKDNGWSREYVEQRWGDFLCISYPRYAFTGTPKYMRARETHVSGKGTYDHARFQMFNWISPSMGYADRSIWSIYSSPWKRTKKDDPARPYVLVGLAKMLAENFLRDFPIPYSMIRWP